tara:strand:- start:317 stop:1294 length:978 start_codon:yes stop_codon:yes gene_type:complete
MKKLYIHCNIPENEVRRLKKNFSLKIHNADNKILDERELLTNASGFDGIISQGNQINEKFLNKNRKILKVISNVGVGFDNIDINSASRYGIAVLNTPGVLNYTMADYTIGMLLSLTRRICEGDNFVRAGKWKGNSWPLFWGSDLFNESLGIIGMGNIGKEVAKRAITFGVKIFYNNRKKLKEEEEKKLNIKYLEFNDLITKCKFIILLCPLNKDSKYLFNKEIFKRMRNDSILINVARGKIIKELDLVEALKFNHIGGAALDVFENEPKVNKKLFELKNVILMPHAGSATSTTRKKMISMACQNICEYLLFKDCKNLVNKEILNV